MSDPVFAYPDPTSCSGCPVRDRALFQRLPDDAIRSAESVRFAQYRLPARQHLYCEGGLGDVAYTLREGWVLLYRSHSDGSRQGLRIALPGDLIGYLPPGQATMRHSAFAITTTVLCAFRQEGLHSLLDQRPSLALQVLRIHDHYAESYQAYMLGLGRKSALQRTAYLIAELYQRLKSRGEIAPGSHQMAFPLTQGVLGDLTGLTPVHTNRVMRRLREERVVSVAHHRLKVHDLGRLMEIGGFVPSAAA